MFINSLFRKLSKCGFTLIEALIASILVGSCIMPIVGTMQNAESMTQRMVDDNKLQMLARSRMNLETSRANNDQNNVDTTTMYCYEYYRDPSNESTKNSVMTTLEPSKFYIKNENFSVSKPSTFDKFINEFLIKAYSVEVEVKDDVILKDGDDNSDSNFNGLKQIVVTARVIARSGEAYCNSDGVLNSPVPENSKSYSLVSLITVPIVSTEYIWALDSKNNKVLGIDPVTGLVGVAYSLNKFCKTTFDGSGNSSETIINISNSFTSLLVKPDGKSLLLIGAGTRPLESSITYYYGNFCIDPSDSKCGYFVSGENMTLNHEKYYSVFSVLRHDGKVAFFTSNCSTATSNEIIARKINWDSKSTVFTSESKVGLNNSSDLKAGNDGYLYYLNGSNSLYRLPMYAQTMSNSSIIFYECTDGYSIIDYALSPNGKKLYILYKSSDSKYYLDTVNTLTGETNNKVEDLPLRSLFYSIIIDNKLGLQVTGDGKYLAIYYAGYISDKPKILFYNITDGSTHPYVYSNSTSSGEFQFNKLIYAPITNTLIADICNTGEINLCDYAVYKDNVLNSKTNVPITTTKISEPNAIVDYAARNPEYLWVTTKESSNYKIKAIDLASGSYEYEKEIDLGNEPQLAAMSPSGEKIVTISNGNKYKVSDTVLASVTTPLTTNNSLEETSTQILFANTEDNNTLGIVANDGTTLESFSTLNLSDSTVTKIGELDKAYWNYKKVIGLHDGSFLALARRNDPANGTSLIDWFGKNSDNTYSKWARWVTNAKNTIKTEVYKPDDAVYDSVTNTSADECDMWYGGIVIYKEMSSNTPGAPFSIGTKIKKIKFLSSAYTQAVYPTSITPVILKNKSTEAVDINNYIIVDYGQEIFVDGPDKQYEEEINWQNGGEMGDHCYVGWINGSFDYPSCGAISYKHNSTNCSFYADISFGDAQPMPDDSTITAFPAIGKDNDVGKTELNIRTGTYQRDYKVQFMYEKETASTITSFPPENAIDIAITPDDRTLAVTTFDGTSGKINLYDFGAYNFATETQLVGMVSDFRAKNVKYFEDGSSYCYYDLGMSKVYSGYSFKSGSSKKLSDALNGYGLWSLSEHPANYKKSSGSDINKRFFGYYTSYSSFKNKIGENVVKKDYVGFSDSAATRVFINQKPAEADSYSKPYYKDENRSNTKVHSSLLEYDQAEQSEYVTVQLAAKYKNVDLPSDWHSLNPFVRSISENYFVQVSTKTNYSSIEPPKKIVDGLISSSNYEKSIFLNHLYLSSLNTSKEIGKSMEFEYKIPNGNVKVELYFCETVESTANRRYFNVAIEDVEVLSNFNILKEANGINKVVVKTFDTKVTDGAINIKFSNGISNQDECAAISAIRLTYLKPKKDNETKLLNFPTSKSLATAEYI